MVMKQNSPLETDEPTKVQIPVQTDLGRWQQPQLVELKFTAAFSKRVSFLPRLAALNHGGPRSPLND